MLLLVRGKSKAAKHTQNVLLMYYETKILMKETILKNVNIKPNACGWLN